MYVHLFCKLFVGKMLNEYEALTKFYNKLTAVFHDKSYLSHFVPAGIILVNDVHHMSDLPDNDRAICLLKNISTPLERNEKQNFYKMLEIMQEHGNLHAQQLADNMKAFVTGMDTLVIIKSTKAVATSSEGIYKNK